MENLALALVSLVALVPPPLDHERQDWTKHDSCDGQPPLGFDSQPHSLFSDINYYNAQSLEARKLIEGLWILQIQPPPVTTGGVVVFVNGKVFGGDNGFSWVGTYSCNGNLVKGRVHVYNFDPEIKSILGVPGDYDMHFSGNVQGDTITGTAMIANQPQHSLAMKLDKRAPL